MKKLNIDDLKNDTFINYKEFSDTSFFEYEEKVIGQEKGLSAINFGLKVKDFGYNIYIAGDMGTGKTTSAKLLAQKVSANEPPAPDFVYLYNFDTPKEPILVELPKSFGAQLKEDLEEVMSILEEEIPIVFGDKRLINKKNKLLRKFEEDKENVLKKLSEEIEKDNFQLKHSQAGVLIMPIINGEVVSEDEYDMLSEEEKETIRANSLTTNIKVENTIERIRNKEKDLIKKIDDIDNKEGLVLLEKHFSKVFDKYSKLENEKLMEYFESIKKDILENLQEFLPAEQLSEDSLQDLLAGVQKNGDPDFLNRYKVNLFIDNSKQTNAKVLVVENPTYSNLFGEIECEYEGNNIVTNFMKIKAGALQEGYGGYIIINCYDLLTNNGAYEKLRNILKTKKITVDAETQVNNAISYSLIKPETMEFNSKIILVGSFENYYNISHFDDDFRKYFKVLSTFDIEMNNDADNRLDIVNFILGHIKRNNSLHFTKEAIAEILKYSQRLSGSKLTLDTNFNLLTELLIEATIYAKELNQKVVEKENIKKAIISRNNRFNQYEEKMYKMINDGVVMIDTSGEVVGQINGLCVISTYDYSFGIPSKITATTYIGSEGIVNIEKEASMSGSIHEKGVEVLSGYLGEKYSQDFPLCLSSRICFEQNYNGVDGDSASSTELYCILSSLADLPIKQHIAVTGSINQKGFIQAIGGVTEKVEGFYKLCKQRGLEGHEGVIIPRQNVNDLVLNDEVLESIKKGEFSIFAIDTIEEGMELLTGKKMGEKVNGEYEEGSINYLVYEKLKKYYDKLNVDKKK